MTGANRTGKLIGIARRERPSKPMETIDEVAIQPTGLEGERPRKEGHQVTILSREAWEAATNELAAELPWTTRRANLLVEGLSLTDALGARLRIGDVLLEVTEETKPCQLMDRFHAGLRAALTPGWRGGATCRVVSGGELRVGDAAGFE